MSEDFIGRWAVNGAGLLGKITDVRTDARGEWVYIGEGITGEDWRSRAPILLQGGAGQPTGLRHPGGPVNYAERLLAAGFDQIIPLRKGTRIPAIKGWSQRGAATLDEARSWDATGKNIGLLARDFPGIDIDCDDAQLTARIVKMARDVLGNAPARVRGARALLPYRTSSPFKKIVLTFRHPDHDKFVIEVLGDGQQYAVAGAREDGTSYTWVPEPLWDTLGPDDLTITTKQDVEDFLVQISDELFEEGWTAEKGTGAERENAPDQESLQAPSMDELRTAVMSIPNKGKWDERSEWLKMMAAIKGAGAMDPGAALALAIEWSQTWDGADDSTVAATTAAFESFGEVMVGWNWIRDEAKAVSEYNDAASVFPMAPPPPAGAAPPPPPGNPFRIDGVITYSDVWKVHMVLPELKDELRYASGVWYFWDGARWKHDELGVHRLMVQDLLAAIAIRVRAYAETLTDSAMQQKTMTVAKGLQGKTSIENTINLLQPQLAMLRDDFDQELMQLGTPGGVVDLTTGELKEASPDNLISRSTAATPRKGPRPMFDSFISHLTGGDEEMATFLQRYAGYALTGRMEEKVFLYGFGSDSDTGKSTFIHILQGVMGEYARTVDIETFINSRKGDTGYTLAQLPGVRLVTATEPKRGQTWDEKTIKTITGGDELQVRAIYGHPFTFQPQFKLLIAGNAEPSLRTVDDAMLRRVLIVPMNEKVTPEERIDNLAELIIEEEGHAVLQWMVEGALEWAEHGLALPERVAEATQEYGEAEDSLGEWLSDECELGEDYATHTSVLFESFQRWCKARGLEAGTMRTFSRELKARRDLELTDGRFYVGGKQLRGFTGIRVKSPFTLTEDEES